MKHYIPYYFAKGVGIGILIGLVVGAVVALIVIGIMHLL